MKTGIFIAVILHIGFILFGGLIFNSHKDAKANTVTVELVNPDDVAQTKPVEPKTAVEQTEEPIAASQEPPPNADFIRSINPIAAAPGLAAMDLGAINDLLNHGLGAGGESWGQQGSFASGGVVGGTGKPGAIQDTTEQTITMSEIDQKARTLFQTAPVFPSELRGKDIDGTVVVIFIVTPDGRVTNQRAESSNHPAFEKPALDAVRQWTFESAMRGGQKVPSRMRVTIRFQRS
jgi:periplasmic protein TonB